MRAVALLGKGRVGMYVFMCCRATHSTRVVRTFRQRDSEKVRGKVLRSSLTRQSGLVQARAQRPVSMNDTDSSICACMVVHEHAHHEDEGNTTRLCDERLRLLEE